LAGLVEARQYGEESFGVDFDLAPGDIPVRRGDIIGYSGNSGSSGGPHLHLELRRLRSNEPLDPLAYYKAMVRDGRRPEALGVRAYGVGGRGWVARGGERVDLGLKSEGGGAVVRTDTVVAWGEVGLAVRAVDRMDGTGFGYGLKEVAVVADGVETFRYRPEVFAFGESGFINSCIDFGEWKASGRFWLKTFTEPGNGTRFVASRGRGIIDVREERDYDVRIVLKDIYGNGTEVRVVLRGERRELKSERKDGGVQLRWYEAGRVEVGGMRLELEEGCLYDSHYIRYDVEEGQGVISKVYRLKGDPVALKFGAGIEIMVDGGVEIGRAGIVRIERGGSRMVWIGGRRGDGVVAATVGELGSFAVAVDSVCPVIVPVGEASWGAKGEVRMRIGDGFSGVGSLRGEIDGRFALFEYDAKSGMVSYRYDRSRVAPGVHRVALRVADRAGNVSLKEFTVRF
jgi:hypothetical protein